MKTRAPSADGANLGHHAEPTLGEDLCAGTVGVGSTISARSKSLGRRGYDLLPTSWPPVHRRIS